MATKQSKKIGRPAGKTGTARESLLRVRILEDERVILAGKAKARGLPLSTWARDTLLSAAR